MRIGYRDDPPFVEAINTPALHDVYDRLAGAGRWIPRPNVGTFPIRFPTRTTRATPAGTSDTSSTPGADNRLLHSHVDTRSDGKVLLLLLLFSEVGDDDAPTQQFPASARTGRSTPLESFGEAGADVFELMPLPEGEHHVRHWRSR